VITVISEDKYSSIILLKA